MEHPHPLSALLDTSLAPHLEFDPSLNGITPVPSQILTVYNNNQPLNITLDSGATVSFIRLAVAIEHNFTIQPNQQLALLADEKTRLAALGEIDVTLTRANFTVRLRALVVKNLQSACFGGTNFHLENDIEPRIKHICILPTARFKRVALVKPHPTLVTSLISKIGSSGSLW